MSRLEVRYAQCWEDPRLSREALAVGPDDDVLSIASGGENGLAFLLDRPRSVTLIDRNPAQIHLVELKVLAARRLDREELLGFLGARPGPDKDRLYDVLRPGLSGPARAFWDRRRDLIRDGLFHCGRYERFFRAAIRYVVPLIHSRKTLRALLDCPTVGEQAAFYRDVWTNRRWRTLFRLVFGKRVFGRWGRQRSHYRYVTAADTWRLFYDRAERELSQRLVRDHPGLAYFFKESAYPRPENLPLWLQAAHFPAIREGLDRLKLRTAGLDEILAATHPGDFSKFNLSTSLNTWRPGSTQGRSAESFAFPGPGDASPSGRCSSALSLHRFPRDSPRSSRTEARIRSTGRGPCLRISTLKPPLSPGVQAVFQAGKSHGPVSFPRPIFRHMTLILRRSAGLKSRSRSNPTQLLDERSAVDAPGQRAEKVADCRFVLAVQGGMGYSRPDFLRLSQPYRTRRVILDLDGGQRTFFPPGGVEERSRRR